MANTARTGELQEGLTPVVPDWFERMHGLPRAKQEFGFIVSQTDQDYELHNAHRTSGASITSIENNATPGMETPGVAPPVVIPRNSSLFDSTSTSNSGTSGLGTIVKTKLRATIDGLASFDTSVAFHGTPNSVTFLVSGMRIALVPIRYESPVVEVLQFLTTVLEKVDGTEQRISPRVNYRELLQVSYLLDALERQRLHNLITGGKVDVLAVPMFHEEVFLSAAVSSGTLTYPVTGADDVDFRVNGLAVALQDETTFDVFEIDAATDTLITAKAVSTNGYAAGTSIIPLRLVRIVGAVDGELHRGDSDLERFDVKYLTEDNATGALTGSTAAFSTYKTRVLLDDCNLMPSSTASQEHAQRVHRIDNETGIVTQSSTWSRSRRVSPKGFHLPTRSSVKDVKRLLVALRGKQKALWIPTFKRDLTIKAGLVAASADIDITHVGYTDYARSENPKKVVKITFNDGTGAIVREVDSSIEVDATTERLTLDATLGVTKAVSTIDKVQFYEPIRMDTDVFRIERRGDGQGRLRVPVKAVFDLD